METNTEVWKPIPGYEGLYEASTFGRIRSLDGVRSYKGYGKTIYRMHKGKILKQSLDGRKNYLHVALSDGVCLKPVQVHRIIAKTFIINPFDLPEVNHKDEDKTNNAVWNLEWCDHKYNSNYGSKKSAVQGEKNGAARLTKSIVKAIRDEYIPYDREHGITGLAKKYGISVVHAYQIVNRKRWGWLD